MPVLRAQTEAAVGREVEGRVAAVEDFPRELGDAPGNVLEVDESRQLAAELEQRRRALGLAPRRLVQACVLDGDGRMPREDLEQPDLVLVELVQAELRD